MNDEEAYSRLAALCEVIDRWADRRDEHRGPQVGSRLDSDDALTDPYHLSHAVDVSINTALDHLRALRALLVDAHASGRDRERSPSAVAPHPRRPGRPRARAPADVRPDAQERDTADALLGATPTGRYTLTARKDRFAGLADAAGIDRQRILQRPPGFATIVREANDHVGGGLPLEYLWRLGSG